MASEPLLLANAQGLTKDAVRARLCKSVAIAHGVGLHMSLLELCVYIDEHGLPTPEERERIRAAKLEEDDADGGNTTTSSSPG